MNNHFVNEKRINEFINDLKKEKLVQKYLYQGTRLSGSSTVVYPITISQSDVTLQWTCDKRIFDKFIQKIVDKNQDLIKYGIFWKTDGSCPSRITFRFH